MSDYVHNAIMTQSQETPASKKRAFRIWCIENEVTITELAARIGISQPALSTALCKETIPVRRHAALKKEGVPAHLLPRPEDVPSGPKPKHAA